MMPTNEERTPHRMHIDTTGNGGVDLALCGLIDAFEAAFPKRIRGYHIEGSHADGTSVGSSDVDVTVVFKDSFADAMERERAEILLKDCATSSAVEIDGEVSDEEGLRNGVTPAFKWAARLIYGEDTRERLPVMPIEEWTRDRMHTSYYRIISLFDRPLPITYPLDYPDPTAAFYGYDRRTVRRPDGSEAPSTRDLIRLTGWMATALVALDAGQYVARKRDCHALYRRYIGDEWCGLLDDVYETCRNRWNYLIPTAPDDRARLRDVCRRTLAFENSFLTRYRAYVVSELRGADPQGREQAVWVMRHFPFHDAEIETALGVLES